MTNPLFVKLFSCFAPTDLKNIVNIPACRRGVNGVSGQRRQLSLTHRCNSTWSNRSRERTINP